MLHSNLPFPVRRGKVRDVYDLGDRLLLVATDRISAFDWVMPNGIPDKGRILTQISAFWFELLGVPNHLISQDVASLSLPAEVDRAELVGRSMIVRKAQVVPIECVVRGYLDGSGWKEYKASGTVCGISLPAGLGAMLAVARADLHAGYQRGERPRYQHLAREDGGDHRRRCRPRSPPPQPGRLLARREYARTRGMIIADTKFEWGWHEGNLILIDEVLTPDSSRFWPADQYQPGRPQPSYDKQFVRDWLETTGWDKNSPPPALPEEVVARTRGKYIEAYEKLTGKTFV